MKLKEGPPGVANSRANKFENIIAHAEKLENLVGPVYQCGHANNFQEVIKIATVSKTILASEKTLNDVPKPGYLSQSRLSGRDQLDSGIVADGRRLGDSARRADV